MKALILTLGTRGDVQPFAALARGLAAAGHEAVVGAPHRFAELVTAPGVRFAGIDEGPLRLVDDAGGAVIGEVAAGGLRAKAALALRLPGTFGRVLADCWAVAEHGPGAGADVVVHNGQVIAGPHVAERLGKPAVLGLPIPMFVPTREFPWPGQAIPGLLPRRLNRATYLGMKGPALVFARTVDRWRDTLGLPRRRGRHDPLLAPDGSPAPALHAVSRHVLPRPADWPANAAVTGYWFLPPAGEPLPPELTAFLDAGPPPVYVGFGSMSGPDPAATTATVLGAARRAGVRVVLGTGWGGLSAAAGPDVFVVGEVPFDGLFPHVAAVVHHGGAGTVAAAAAAGRPQLVCPFVGDQQFWGRRVHRLGVGPAPLDQRDLAVGPLAAAIERAVSDAETAARAAELGELVRAERGVEDAVAALEALVGG